MASRAQRAVEYADTAERALKDSEELVGRFLRMEPGAERLGYAPDAQAELQALHTRARTYAAVAVALEATAGGA